MESSQINEYLLKVGGDLDAMGEEQSERGAEKVPLYRIHFFRELVAGLSSLRESDTFSDVTVKVGGSSFRANRVVLAGASEFFRALFSAGLRESTQSEVELHDDINLTSESFQIILNYIYSSVLDLSVENVFDILTAAHHLRINSAVEYCCDFIKNQFYRENLNFDDFVQITEMADHYSLLDVREVADNYIAQNFINVSQTDDFLEYMTAKRFGEFLLRSDLAVSSELQVLKSVVSWIKRDPKSRLLHATSLIKKVRLGFIGAQDLMELFDKEIRSVPQCRDIYNELMQHHAIGKPVSGTFPLQHPEFFASRGCTKSLIAVGGRTSMSCIRFYDANTKMWYSLKAFAQPPYSTFKNHAVAVVGNTLFIAGGEYFSSNKWQTRNYTYRYDVVNNKWSSLLPMKAERSSFRLLHHHGYLYALGGRSRDGKPLRSVERYSLTTGKWQLIASLHSARHSLAAAVYQGKIYAMGGSATKVTEGGPSKTTAPPEGAAPKALGGVRDPVMEVECFDPSTNTWKGAGRLSAERVHSCAEVIGDTLYVAGGTVSPVTSDPATEGGTEEEGSGSGEGAIDVEEFNPEHQTWSGVGQQLVPLNSIGAFRVGNRVYFNLQGYCYDSRISIAEDQVYDVDLDDWAKLNSNTYSAAVTQFTFSVTKLS